MANEHEEERLRQLLRDDGWSLPAWPDTEARVRRAARRQRLATAGASTVVCALAAAAIVLPLKLIGPPKPSAGPRPQAAATHSSTPAPTSTQDSFKAPPVGAPGFPADLYPPPRTRLVLSRLGYCPSGIDLQPFQQLDNLKAISVLRTVTRANSLKAELKVTDRAIWPSVLQNKLWPTILQRHPIPSVKQLVPGSAGPILYSGPVQNYSPVYTEPWAPTVTLAHYCGSWLELSTWLIVKGPADNPSLQDQLYFINRGGHVLLYFWE